MIELMFTGKCNGCKCADLELDYFTIESFDDPDGKEWTVRCIHEDACARGFYLGRISREKGEDK